MSTADDRLHGDVAEALANVLDPCSIAMCRPTDLVAMGLVEGIDVEQGRVAVRLVLTDPMCFLQADILRAAEEAVRAVPGVRECDISLDGNILWTAERMATGKPR